jgi:hypothetical protein
MLGLKVHSIRAFALDTKASVAENTILSALCPMREVLHVGRLFRSPVGRTTPVSLCHALKHGLEA